ncbi:MAG: TrkA family potassium uptake protein [Thiohalobacterales bacterium]
MHNLVYLLLRRMRLPLIIVILAYAISILGMVLIPGIDDQGNPWRMDFFHAFYFVSFLGSTIGFGELPYPFTDAQRLWTMVAIYTTVIAWLFAIGSLFSLFSDPAFRRILSYTLFTRAVRGIREPFYLVCGLDDAGHLLVHELAGHCIRTVVIDNRESRVQALQLDDLPVYVPALCADAADAATLSAAGVNSRHCRGVIALTDSDPVNLTIAITSKLLSPKLQVICRSESHDSEANMASFGTEHIINPFDTFARRFALMLKSPGMFLVYEWLTSIRDAPLREFAAPPKGTWVICGYGRFGKAIQKALSFEGIHTVLIESDIEKTAAPEGVIVGRGTEAITLYEADIENADGIIAGTDDDSNNLSIIITAVGLNKNLFTVGRQNRGSNEAIFNAARLDVIMQPGAIISQRIVALLTTPLLTDFLRLARQQGDSWANILVSRVIGVLTDRPPDSWTISVDAEQAPAMLEMIGKGNEVTIGMLCTDPRNLAVTLPCVPLYLQRTADEILLPGNDCVLQPGDRVLFCGRQGARTYMRWTMNNFNALNYISTGKDRPSGYLWRWLAERHASR